VRADSIKARSHCFISRPDTLTQAVSSEPIGPVPCNGGADHTFSGGTSRRRTVQQRRARSMKNSKFSEEQIAYVLRQVKRRQPGRPRLPPDGRQ
jgi:hypothetical protein